ncbi:MAG TPA: agglutinin biogenesis protein MshP [Telluria sp.]|jgi:MSHA biogenesis protein MshP
MSARQFPRLSRVRGVSLITAVFLIVLLAGLTAALVRVFGAQQAASAMDMLGSQAYQAARSGLEWGMFQQLRVQPPSVACFASPQTFALPSDGNLRNFSVTVSCTPKAGNAVGNTTNRWTLVAVACNQLDTTTARCPNANPGADYVQRTVQAELN